MVKKSSSYEKAQVWIETAIYTLIGLTIIAIILTAVLPQIEIMKDRSIIKQTITALDSINSKIMQVQEMPGNIGIVYLSLAKGELRIDSEKDSIVYTLEQTRLKLSEPGVAIEQGGLNILTEKIGDRYNIIITKDYSRSLNLTYNTKEESKQLFQGSTPYKISIENTGENGINQKINLDFNIL